MADKQKHRTIRYPTRRCFFREIATTAVVLVCGSIIASADLHSGQSPGAVPPGTVTQLSKHLLVFHGPISVGIIRDGDRSLLIDTGDGRVREVLAEHGISEVQKIVFTHHHRDQAFGAYELAAAGTKIGVPNGEREYFANPASYWDDDASHWRVYRSFRPHPLMLTQPLRVDEAYTDGHEMAFGPAKIRVLSTPGHTEGAVSYVVEVDGNRVVFCGDCIYDKGQVWDIYSLQKGFSKRGQEIGGYHGFMGDRWGLASSLGRIRDLRPDVLVPSHGNLMREPAKAIDTLVERLEACYENYVAISALRHYFPKLFTGYAGRPGQMPIRPGIEAPDCLRHFGTTWMLVSESRDALVMDVGSTGIVGQIEKMLDQGEIKSVEGLWVTHYHFDHTDGIPKFQQQFDCPCITDRRLADVLIRPRAWRLPCLATEPIRVDRPMEDGQSWQWREFKMTSFYYPGQTLYHSALFAEREDLRMLFVGDSHTMSGIDDYCAYNRNWLGRGVGFQYCLDLIEKLNPTHIFNCHVNDAFTFTPDEIRFMRENLDKRETLFGQLVPWDHPNYATDPLWVRCHPYSQTAKPGERVQFEVVITNHSTSSHAFSCGATLPQGFRAGSPRPDDSDVASKSEGRVTISLDVLPDARPGRRVVPVDVQYGPWQLPQFTETIVDVSGSP